MSRTKSIACIIGISCLLLNISNCSASDSKQEFDYRGSIDQYKEKLKAEPENCLYLEQIASSYQALNDYDNAISFYKKSLDNCPNNLLNKFQLGICYYLTMDRDKGVGLMDEAINDAEKSGDRDMVEMFKKEKKSWLEKWDSVKELEWNKRKKPEGAAP